MFKLSVRKDSNTLFFNGKYLGIRCREYSGLKDTRDNRKLLSVKLKRMNEDLQKGIFRYRNYFPESKLVLEVQEAEKALTTTTIGASNIAPIGLPQYIPTLFEYSELWLEENTIRWRRTHRVGVEGILAKYILPVFGNTLVNQIKREHLISFRAQLADIKLDSENRRLSNARINKIMGMFRQIISEAASRYDFTTPYNNIKQLKNNPKDIHPFSLKSVLLFLEAVRDDYKNYYTVRFFTGMRTGEIDGLKWRYVDFEKRQILIRETIVEGRQEKSAKTDSSIRDIQMSEQVFDALSRQYRATAKMSEYVFCTLNGSPLAHRNVTRRVWKPTLAKLGLEYRKPYQTRHTAATLWLAAGEAPEWIAKQLGHANTMMLFTVYSRFVPNLTRQDGSAFESLLAKHIMEKQD